MSQRTENDGGRRLRLAILIASVCVLTAGFIWWRLRDNSQRDNSQTDFQTESSLQLVRPAMQIYEQYSGLDREPLAVKHFQQFVFPGSVVHICSHGEWIVVGVGRDFEPFNTIDIRELRTGRLINRIVVGTYVYRAQLSPCHQYVAVSGQMSGPARIYDVMSGEHIWTAARRRESVRAVAFAGRRRFAVAGGKGSVALF